MDGLYCIDIIPDQPSAENILRNPSFEHSIVPNSLNGWLCEGGLLTQYSSDHHGEGLYSGRCSNRVADWTGPGQYIGMLNSKYCTVSQQNRTN